MSQMAAFLSYARFDDEHGSGKITDIRKRLSGEVRALTGREFQIFQDRGAISWGQNWQERIVESVEATTFFIPILTPSFFSSEMCQKELKLFMDREERLERSDLILPIYYIDCSHCDADNALTELVFSRQYFDMRDFRFKDLSSQDFSEKVADMANQICESLKRHTVVPRADHQSNDPDFHGHTFPDSRLNSNPSFGDNLQLISATFISTLDNSSQQDRFIHFAAHICRSAANSIDQVLRKFSKPGAQPVREISLKIRSHARMGFNPDCTKQLTHVQYWQTARNLATELQEIVNAFDRLRIV